MFIRPKVKECIFVFYCKSNKKYCINNNLKMLTMNIGVKINNLMRDHNITQEILADYTGVSQTKIHDIVSGKTQKVDFIKKKKVCEVFEVGFEYFLDENQTINNVEKAENCNIGCNTGIVNKMPEGILENMLKRIESLEKLISSK